MAPGALPGEGGLRRKRTAAEVEAENANSRRIIQTYEWVGEQFRKRYTDRPELLASLLRENDRAIEELQKQIRTNF